MTDADDADYEPVDCSFHDRIEELATLRRTVCIAYRDDGGEAAELTDVVADWFVKERVEYLRTRSGQTIRLDRLIALDEVG